MTGNRYFASAGGSTREAVVHEETVRFEPAADGSAGDAPPAEAGEATVRVLSGEGRVMVTLEGRTAVGFAARRDGVWKVEIEGRQYTVRVDDERMHRIRELTAEVAPGGVEVELRAPMPGLVVHIEVAPGDQVRAGDGLVVMEAMKMENELRAEREGMVEDVHVAEGATVDRDDLLVTFTRQEST